MAWSNYLRYLIFLAGFLCAHSNAESQLRLFPADTTAQLRLNAFTEADRQLYTLTIISGKIAIANAVCDPPRNHYDLSARLTNNSNDTLKYIDWTTDANIWKVDIEDGFVVPTDVYPCDRSIDHNFITYYTLPPHQSAIIQLSIIFKTEVIPINKEFRVGMIIQRVKKIEDFWYYMNYFRKHSLWQQTINLIWSNSIKMIN